MKSGQVSDADAPAVRQRVVELVSARPDALVLVTSDIGSYRQTPDWLGDVCTVTATEKPLQLIDDHDRGVAVGLFQAARQNGTAEGVVRLNEDPGTPHRISVFGIDEDDGERLFVFVMVADESAEFPTRSIPEVQVPPRRIVQVLNGVGTVQRLDEAAKVLMGWTDELIGTPALDWVHESDHDALFTRWIEMLQGEGATARGRAQYRTIDGEWKWFEVTTTNRLESEGVCISEMLDVTSEMVALSQLRYREEVLRRLTDALPGGVAHFGADGQLVFANDRLETITGMTNGKIVDFRHLFDPSLHETMTRLCVEALHEGVDQDLEVELIHPSGEPRFVRMAFRSLKTGDGEGGFLVCFDDITESWLLRQELALRAETDSLTRVANRHALLESLREAIVDRRSSGVAVIYLDLNGFKGVNDTLGHSVGDEILRATARRLGEAARATDVVGRIGGDEFVVVCPNTEPHVAAKVAERLRAAVNQPVCAAGTEVEVSAACGYRAVTAMDSLDADCLLGEADQAMYHHKRVGGPRPIKYEDVTDELPKAS